MGQQANELIAALWEFGPIVNELTIFFKKIWKLKMKFPNF